MIHKIIDLYRGNRYPILREIRQLKNPPVVYMVGARDGLPSTRLQYLQRHKAIVSVGFEPDADEVTKLKASGALDFVSASALGNESKIATLHLTKMRGASSLYEPDVDFLKRLTRFGEDFQVERDIEVSLRRLDEVIEEENLPLPNMLNIDAQASELDIIEGAGRYLKGISVLTLEVQTYPAYKSQKLFHEITRNLWDKGFVCCQIDDPNNNPVFGPYVVEANASYVNLELLEGGDELTKTLMELARLGERAQSAVKTWISGHLRRFGFNA